MKNSWETYSGDDGKTKEFEAVSTIECDWNSGGYLSAQDKDDNDSAQMIVRDWVEKHLPKEDADKWGRMRREDKINILLDWAKNNQPKHWNPLEPLSMDENGEKHNVFAGDLYAEVAEALNIDMEDLHELKFFTSADTPLDTLYGTDAFFEFKGSVLRIDVTTNPEKVKTNGDIVILLGDLKNAQQTKVHAEIIGKSLSRKLISDGNAKMMEKRRVA